MQPGWCSVPKSSTSEFFYAQICLLPYLDETGSPYHVEGVVCAQAQLRYFVYRTNTITDPVVDESHEKAFRSYKKIRTININRINVFVQYLQTNLIKVKGGSAGNTRAKLHKRV